MVASEFLPGTVTVIVPTYNSARFLSQALDSIFGQTHVPEQIIVVDDGSTDDTVAVLRRYGRRIQAVIQPNRGVSGARNVGLQLAKCDFIAFLDADDRWRPTYIERMREMLIADPRTVCAFANFRRFEEATGEFHLRDQFSYYPELCQRMQSDDLPSAAVRSFGRAWAFRSLVAFGEIPAFPVVTMYRRNLISGLRFDTNLRVCEDTHFALRAFMRGSVAFTSEILCHVRRHGDNATHDHHTIALHKLEALKALSPYVVGAENLSAYRDRLVKAHIDAAIYQTRAGNVRAGLRNYLESFCVYGSAMRKLKGSVRLALALPRGLTT